MSSPPRMAGLTTVSAITRDDGPHGVELSAKIGQRRLWFRFPSGTPVSTRGDTFLAAALLPAMMHGGSLAVEAEVSPRLLAAVEKLQDIFLAWKDHFGLPFKRVKIEAASAPAATLNPGTMSFFSGGVDGWDTLLKHREEISTLAFARGIDIQPANTPLAEEVTEVNRRIAGHYRKELLCIDTNIRFFGHECGVGWDPAYVGSGLAAIALALGFAKVLVAGSISYGEQIPYGTHYLTDPLWSTEGTGIVYDGAESLRTDKLIRLGAEPLALETLRVCWRDRGYNCGSCEKCLRTMIALRLLGLQAARFPPLKSRKQLAGLAVWNESECMFLEESLRLAEEKNDPEILTALRQIRRAYVRRAGMRSLDEALTGGSVRRALRGVRSFLKKSD